MSSWRRVRPGCFPIPRSADRRRECRADVSRSAGVSRPPVVGGVRNCGLRCLRALPAEGTAVWLTPGWWWFGGAPGDSVPGGLVTGRRMREHPRPPATNISSNGDAGRRSPGYVLATGVRRHPFLSYREMRLGGRRGAGAPLNANSAGNGSPRRSTDDGRFEAIAGYRRDTGCERWGLRGFLDAFRCVCFSLSHRYTAGATVGRADVAEAMRVASVGWGAERRLKVDRPWL